MWSQLVCDLVGRDPTPDAVGLSTGITSASLTVVVALESLQLIAPHHVTTEPVTAVGRDGHAA